MLWHSRMDHLRSMWQRYTCDTRSVYDRCMTRLRTNIEIEDELVQVVMTRYSVRTKTEAVDLALRHLAGQPMSRDEALSMRGARAMEDVPEDRAPRGTA
jgi:Arc/MetJ family transcription regulator